MCASAMAHGGDCVVLAAGFSVLVDSLPIQRFMEQQQLLDGYFYFLVLESGFALRLLLVQFYRR